MLKKVARAGGPPVRISDASGVALGATWNRGDVIVYTLTERAGLFQISAQGGKPKVLTTPDFDNQERSHRYPHFLPDGKSLLFFHISANTLGGIWALSLQTGKKKFITAGTSPHYLPTGYLVYAGYDGSLHAAPFDPARLELTGPAIPLFAGIALSGNDGAQFSVSDNGSLAYVPATKQDRQLILVDRAGREQLISDEARPFSLPRFSRDGHRLSLHIADSDMAASNFWIYEFDQSTLSRLTSNLLPLTGEWTPDGQRGRDDPNRYHWRDHF